MKHALVFVIPLVVIFAQQAAAQFVSDPRSSKVKSSGGLVVANVNAEITSTDALFGTSSDWARFFVTLPTKGLVSTGPVQIIQPLIGVSAMSSVSSTLPLLYVRGELGFSQDRIQWAAGMTVQGTQIIDACISLRGFSKSNIADSSETPKNTCNISTILFLAPNVNLEYGVSLRSYERAIHSIWLTRKIAGFGAISGGVDAESSRPSRRFLAITFEF